jgi:SagB-type dehydrogenase family enzyme
MTFLSLDLEKNRVDMTKGILLTPILCLSLIAIVSMVSGTVAAFTEKSQDVIRLPEPKYGSSTSVEKALRERRSVRTYKNVPLMFSEVSQLLWAVQGITDPQGFRTAPSAGALYPLEVYLVAGNVNNLPAGVYKYRPRVHELIRIATGDKRSELSAAALGQPWVNDGAVVIILSAVYERTTRKYGDRGIRYVHIEAGHAAQNVYLQSVSLHLGTVVIGAFDDRQVKKVILMAPQEEPLIIMPVGRKE